jgi:hypothetical protein
VQLCGLGGAFDSPRLYARRTEHVRREHELAMEQLRQAEISVFLEATTSARFDLNSDGPTSLPCLQFETRSVSYFFSSISSPGRIRHARVSSRHVCKKSTTESRPWRHSICRLRMTFYSGISRYKR